jgi:hypothetical protein
MRILWTIAVVLAVLWLVGLAMKIASAAFHLVIVAAIVVGVIALVRSAACRV